MNKSEIEFANEQSNKMSDLISVSNLLKNSAQIEFTHADGTVGTYINVKAVKFEQQYNSIDAEPIRHGHWISVGEGFNWHYECSLCGYVDGYPFDDRYKRCPNCGAKMDEVSE